MEKQRLVVGWMKITRLLDMRSHSAIFRGGVRTLCFLNFEISFPKARLEGLFTLGAVASPGMESSEGGKPLDAR